MSNQQQEDQPLPRKKIAYLDSESDTDSDSDSDSESGPSKSTSNEFSYKRPSDYLAPKPDLEESPEQRNIRLFQEALKSRRYTRLTEEDEILARTTELEKLYNFPKDNENWREEDLKELWADAPTRMLKPGWDPALVDEEDWKIVRDEVKAGRDPPIAPFYLPYRKPYPAIPSNHYDISNPRDVIEELDRTEEFMQWVSYVFPDGGSYEGTVWDDMAHGKGVYVAQQGLVRYEGEWLQNNQEGHGVVEVEIPDIEPVPGSKLEAQMRAEGKLFRRDFMTPEDREWLEMDIEDSVRLANGNYEIPFYEQEEWIRQYGKKPEKGRYRYAGQWKHGRMHGCGVYEVNERPIFGRFYFGEHVEDSAGCDEEISAMHAGIAEVAAAKARMFVNKPDGMVREERGPYGDPQHPYFYEANEVWQAPGFINQFYEVPEYWKTYVDEVDQEREMWLNSFYKAPLRLPMPAELEYWWEKDAPPEFILLNKEPEPDPNDPTKLIYTEDPLILHTPSGRIIDYVEDEEHGVRLFWRSKGDTDPSKVEFLPLGFDEFFGRKKADEQQEGFLKRLVCSIENFCKPWFEKLEKWTEEQKTASEIRKKLLEQELELVEAELSLEEALEDMEESLKQQEEAADNLDMDIEDEAVSVSPSLPVEQVEEISPEQIKDEGGKAEEIKDEGGKAEEEDDDDDDDDDDDLASSSFGSVSDSKDKKNEPGRSAFSTLSFASPGLLSAVPSILKKSFSDWKKERSPPRVPHESCSRTRSNAKRTYLITFHQSFPEKASLRVKAECDMKIRVKQDRKSFVASQTLPSQLKYSKNNHQGRRSWIKWSCTPPERISDEILSLHIPLESLDSRIRSCNIDQSIAICNHFVVNSKVSVCHL